MINDVRKAIEKLKLNIEIEEQENMVCFDGGVFLHQDGDEYICEVCVVSMATRDEPEDADIAEFARSRNKFDAIYACIKRCLDDQLNGYFEAESQAEAMFMDGYTI